jgi:malate dehydrogenase
MPFRNVTILGAGDLAATLARRLAELELARRVVIVDPEDGRARGKALDIAQSGPVEAFDVTVEGAARLGSVGPAEVLIVADPPALEDALLSTARADGLAAELVSALGGGTLVVAGTGAPALIEAVVARGLPRERAVGSAPVALASALRRRLATELHAEPREVTGLVLGLPPAHGVVPQESATVAGIPVERLSAAALRRAASAITGRPAGPFALAAGAVRVVHALAGARASVLPVFAALAGEYGHRGVALAVPARLAAGRLEAVLEIEMRPVERVAFDNAASMRMRRG